MSTIDERIRDAERRLFARYPLNVSEHFLDLKVQDSPLRVRVLEAGSGSPVVLLHPGTWFAAQWSPLLSRLSENRLLCVDFPGHGLSGAVDYRRHHPRDHTVDMLRQLLSELGTDTCPVVGNSLGGMAALWLAVDAPDLVSKLFVLGLPAVALPGGAPDLIASLMSIPGLNRLLLSLPSSPDRSRNLAKNAFGRRAWEQAPPEIFEIHHLAGRRREFVGTLSTLLQSLFRWRTPRPGMTLTDTEVAGIRQPVHFLWGDDDIFGGPEIAERAAGLMPDAVVEVHPGGHHLQLDDPERCAASIRGSLLRG